MTFASAALLAALYPALPAMIIDAGDRPPPPRDEPTAAVIASDDSPPPAPYVLSLSLRNVNPATGVRLDTVVAPFTDPTTQRGETETVSILSASVKVSEHVSLTGRVAAVRNEQPVATSSSSATGISNPILGAAYGTTLGRHFRLAAALGIGLPVGSGGGNSPDPGVAAAMKAAAFARAGLDNTLFGVNDLGVPVGIDAAYVRGRLTTQVEASLMPSARVKGEQASPDASKVNSAGGFFVGYFILPDHLSLGGELRYQRFLSTPAAVTKDPTQRDNTTAGIGARGYFALTAATSFRPGISYSAGIEGAVSDRHYQMVQVDLPFSF